MNKTKIKHKSAKIPKPMTIKKEKTEEDRSLKPMSHYIDDRLELVKQIFGTLKPKTITNLAPEFLKKKNLEDIEELCLNELLCISTKRLSSIINATKCPSDTESSEDSDVQQKEEHISLEEISSDSEIENSSTAKKKSSTNASTSKKTPKNTTEKDKKNDGQISVLELLELQARARAIRSQLALEPVTKIEVDSDDANNTNIINESSKETKKPNKRKSSEHETSSSTTQQKENGANEENENEKKFNEETQKLPTKKIKIKRNFRKSQQEKTDIENQLAMITTENRHTSPIPKNIKNEKRSRSASPDVITIVAEPETLMISDSSETEADSSKSVSTKKHQVTEKAKEISTVLDKGLDNPITTNTKENKKVRKITEIEDGEITENQTENKVENLTKENANKEDAIAADVVQDPLRNNCVEVRTAAVIIADPKLAGQSTVKDAPEEEQTHSKPSEKQNLNKFLEDEEYDDQNDDVISIEGGDLETEMTEHLEEKDANSKHSYGASTANANTQKQQKDDDVISLDSSEAETEKDQSESWHSRYLKSSKVSKVLAESRLAKRVRDKIKTSKRSKKDSSGVQGEKSTNAYSSKHEDGSVEQYNELLQMRQRKN